MLITVLFFSGWIKADGFDNIHHWTMKQKGESKNVYDDRRLSSNIDFVMKGHWWYYAL